MEKNPKYTFCREFNFEHKTNFFDDDIIIVTSSVRRTESICVIFSLPVFYHNSQVKNRIGMRITNKLNKLMLPERRFALSFLREAHSC